MNKILLIGCGNIAHHYASYFKSKGELFSVHGNGLKTSQSFAEKYSINYTCEENGDFVPYSEFTHVIIASPIETLSTYLGAISIYTNLHVLCEKPGFLNWQDLSHYNNFDNVWFAFNRRFYDVVTKLKALMKTSEFLKIKVEFDERIFQVEKSKKSNLVKKHWMMANTSHVLDLALFLLDYDIDIDNFEFTRMGAIDWHPSGQFFHASYIKDKLQISFDSSWNGYGGWSINVSSPSAEIALKPLEKLTISNEFGVSVFEENNDIKAGFEGMLTSFLGDKSNLMTLAQLKVLSHFIFNLAGYEK